MHVFSPQVLSSPNVNFYLKCAEIKNKDFVNLKTSVEKSHLEKMCRSVYKLDFYGCGSFTKEEKEKLKACGFFIKLV